jgi:ApaG protein
MFSRRGSPGEEGSPGTRVSVFSSETITNGIRVRVQSQYSADKSRPELSEWFFLYTVRITNEGHEVVQLVGRHWIITDAAGHIEEVRGPDVVGQRPILRPGESFEYTSGCPLKTPFGVMEGIYEMTREHGAPFEAKIAPFTLSEPYTVH